MCSVSLQNECSFVAIHPKDKFFCCVVAGYIEKNVHERNYFELFNIQS